MLKFTVVLVLMAMVLGFAPTPLHAQVGSGLDKTYISPTLELVIPYPSDWQLITFPDSPRIIQISNSDAGAAGSLRANQTVLNISTGAIWHENDGSDEADFRSYVTSVMQDVVIERDVPGDLYKADGVEILIFDFGEIRDGYGFTFAIPLNEDRYISGMAISGSAKQAENDRIDLMAIMRGLRPATNAELVQGRPQRTPGFDYQNGQNQVESSTFVATLPDGYAEADPAAAGVTESFQEVPDGSLYSAEDNDLWLLISPGEHPELATSLNVWDTVGETVPMLISLFDSEDIAIGDRPATASDHNFLPYFSWRVAVRTEDGAIFVIEGFRPAGGTVTDTDEATIYGIAASIQATDGYPRVLSTFGDPIDPVTPVEG